MLVARLSLSTLSTLRRLFTSSSKFSEFSEFSDTFLALSLTTSREFLPVWGIDCRIELCALIQLHATIGQRYCIRNTYQLFETSVVPPSGQLSLSKSSIKREGTMWLPNAGSAKTLGGLKLIPDRLNAPHEQIFCIYCLRTG